MDLKKISFAEVRQYCINNGLNFFDFISNSSYAEPEMQAQEKKEIKEKKLVGKVKRKTNRIIPRKTTKSQKDATEIVIETLDEFRKSYDRGQVAPLDDFSAYVQFDLDKYGLRTNSNSPLLGFVADTLYRYAEDVKHGKSPHISKRLENPVRLEEIEELLGINFGEEGAKRIVGFLTPEQVRESYSPSENGRFANEQGEYNIEGIRCWNGEEKEKTRKILADFIKKSFIDETHRKKCEKRNKFESERAEAIAEISRRQNLKTGVSLKISAERGALFAIRKNFMKGYLGGKAANPTEVGIIGLKEYGGGLVF